MSMALLLGRPSASLPSVFLIAPILSQIFEEIKIWVLGWRDFVLIEPMPNEWLRSWEKSDFPYEDGRKHGRKKGLHVRATPFEFLVGRAGLEPATNGLKVRF